MAVLPDTLTAPLNRLARAAVGADWQIYSMLVQHWQEIIAADWAGSATPIKLVFPRSGHRANGVLTISVPRGLSMAAQYQQPHILRQLQRFIGQTVIARVIFVHDVTIAPAKPVRPPLSAATADKMAAAVTAVPDEALRAGLLAFGLSLAQAKPTQSLTPAPADRH
jgi:hypothetical protein